MRIEEFKKQDKVRAIATLFYDGCPKKWYSKNCRIYLWKEKLNSPYNGYRNSKYFTANYKIFYKYVYFYRGGEVRISRRVYKHANKRMQLLRY